VTLLEAGGERAEAELVAEQVLELRRAGMPAGEIVVIYRSRPQAAPLLGHVFAQYGVPLTTGHAPLLAHTPLGRGLLGAARCALLPAGEARPADLLAYLRTPGRLETPEIADGLDADVRREGLRTAAQARERLGWELPELDELAQAADPARALCPLARWLFAAPHRGAAPALTDAEAVDARALRALVTAVDELAQIDLAPTGAELVELLEGLTVPAAASGTGPTHPDAVLLAEPLEVRARRFRAVFVCGLQEGEFPRPASPEPFLSDERRFELASAGGVRLRPREDALAAERYLFYSALSRATERVFLAYRSSDEEGNLALPSPFIADVAELLAPGWAAGRRRRLLADVVWAPERAPTERERARAAADCGAAAGGEPAVRRRVLGADALGRMRHTEILSAGALEAYADCPVRWLIERELQPQPLNPEPEALTRGSLMHDVLERLLGELRGPVTPDTLVAAQAILDRLLAEVATDAGAALGVGSPDVVRAGALRAIEADLRRYLEHEARTAGQWRPLGLELRFGFEGEEGSLPALELGEGRDRVRVRGLVDRVDVDGAGHAVVRDYKSGARRQAWSAARWSEDRQLQVALYMLVVRELTDAEPVAGFYQPLRGEDLRARGVFVKGTPVGSGVVATDARAGEELDEMLADAAERAVALAASLRAGELEPCPQNCSRDGCRYPAICRSQ
jgi:RecB family exonuclease